MKAKTALLIISGFLFFLCLLMASSAGAHPAPYMGASFPSIPIVVFIATGARDGCVISAPDPAGWGDFWDGQSLEELLLDDSSMLEDVFYSHEELGDDVVKPLPTDPGVYAWAGTLCLDAGGCPMLSRGNYYKLWRPDHNPGL